MDLLTAGGRIYHETHYAPLLQMQGAVREIALELRCADSSRLPVLINSTVRSDDDGRPLAIRTTVFNATDRQRYERELLGARDRERASRERAERLQQVTAALATRLAPAEIAEALLVELPKVESVDAAEIVLRGIEPDTIGARHLTGSADALSWAETDPDRLPEPLRKTLRDGRPWFREEDAERGGALRPVAVLPLGLSPGGDSFGAVMLLSRAETPLGEADRDLLLACALQATQALDRAHLLQQTADVAHVLQRSLLESMPIDDPRIRIGTHYSSAVEGLEVGGDWHDAFPLSDDRVGVVVGDVVGRGIRAAAVMGQLRSATRALAAANLGGPRAVMAALDDFSSGLPLASMATLAYAEIDLDSGAVSYACAGHPPPIVIPVDGEPALLWDGRRLPLGFASPGEPGVDGSLTLARGDLLVVCTDGLVERRDESLDDGLARLSHEAEAARGADPQQAVDLLVEALTGDHRNRDDVCAVCVAVGTG